MTKGTYYTYTVELDDFGMADSPRDWDNLGVMVCFHSRYNLGDEHTYQRVDYNSWEEVKEAIMDNHDVKVILPVYMYEHSGVALNTTGFSCQWDSGQVGWIYSTSDEATEDNLRGEVSTYSQYLDGEVYWYGVYKHEPCSLGHYHTELIDSCGGYYDEEQCKHDAELEAKQYNEMESEEE